MSLLDDLSQSLRAKSSVESSIQMLSRQFVQYDEDLQRLEQVYRE
ncbi:MAG TPA: hypothetical protein VK119_10560 [Bacillota bacterium]|nr:hypothetical protein [Bacillota bacterium]